MADQNNNNLKLLVDAAKSLPKTAYGWLFLTVIFLQPVLFYLATNVDDENNKIIMFSSIVLLFALCFFFVLWFGRGEVISDSAYGGSDEREILPTESSVGDDRYGAYISTPMDGFGDDDILKIHREDILKLVDYLETNLGRRVFTAYRDIDRSSDFESEERAFVENFQRIKNSKVFILVLPDKVYSSVFIEVGIALALGKKCLLFLPENAQDVPFLLRGLSRVKNLGDDIDKQIPHILVYNIKGPHEVIQRIRNNHDFFIK